MSSLQRYEIIENKSPREIVLLRARPCAWGRCTFCDYIDDNSTDDDLIHRIAEQELAKVTGRFKRLEVINSASIQEMPGNTLELIRDTLKRLHMTEFICESHWMYHRKFEETRAFFGIPTRIKVGVETFDDHLRNDVLNKNMRFDSPDEVAEATDSICLLVGFRGQTQDTVRKDIDILTSKFRFGCVNLMSPNSINADMIDDDIKEWFKQEYAWLDDNPSIEVLWENTDFGVGTPL